MLRERQKEGKVSSCENLLLSSTACQTYSPVAKVGLCSLKGSCASGPNAEHYHIHSLLELLPYNLI